MEKKTKVENTECAEAAAPKAADYVRKRTEIEVAKLKVAPWNPRAEITPESVADLAASIKSLGMIQPVVAMIDADGGATLIAGHRRLAAAKLARLETVPCDILVGVDEPTAKRMTFIENLQRKDADPLLESELVDGLVKSGMTQAEIAAETGRGREWVARRANLANLSKSWRKRVKDGEQITTDCLEHIAAYPEAVQEKLKGTRSYNGGALRWSEIKYQFGYETCDLKTAKFDRKACKACPNNTGCSPELFDWDGRVTALGKCMDAKCYKSKTAEAIEKAKKEAKADGMEVLELKNHPDYTVQLQDKRDAEHNTLYVWTDYNGDRQMQWGQKPAMGERGGEMSEAQKEERQQKIAANKARRKLAEWCVENLAGLIADRFYLLNLQVALAYQKVFDLGREWRVFGSETNMEDAQLAFLIDPCQVDEAGENWAKLAAPEIAAKLAKPEVGAIYAERLLAIFPGAEKALTEEERRLVVSDERLAKLRAPFKVKWTAAETDAEAEDNALTGDEAEGAE